VNGAEQRARQSVAERLGGRIDNIEPVVEAIDQRVSESFATLDQQIALIVKLARDERGRVDDVSRELRQTCQERWDATAKTTKRLGDNTLMFHRFHTMSLWARLRWLFTGRATL
jgi:hypothetical protein